MTVQNEFGFPMGLYEQLVSSHGAAILPSQSHLKILSE